MIDPQAMMSEIASLQERLATSEAAREKTEKALCLEAEEGDRLRKSLERAEKERDEAKDRVSVLEEDAARIDCGCQDKIVVLKQSEEYALRKANAAELELKKQVAAWFAMKDERDSLRTKLAASATKKEAR